MSRDAIVGVDGSANSESALLWAADWTDRHDTALGVFLVRTHFSELDWLASAELKAAPDSAPVTTEETQRARQFLNEYVETTIEPTAGRIPTAEVVIGDPAGALLEECTKSAPGLLVVGRRGRGGFQRLLVGSVSDQCVTYAECNTAVVPQGFHADERNAVIVVGVDGSEDSQRALAWAVCEAPLYDAKVIVVSTWEMPWGPIASATGSLQMIAYGPEVFAERAAEVARVAVDRVLSDNPAQVHVETEVGQSEPGYAIVATARREKAQMIVVGHRGHSEATSLVLGSVARNCVHHSDCPVVVVRKPEAR